MRRFLTIYYLCNILPVFLFYLLPVAFLQPVIYFFFIILTILTVCSLPPVTIFSPPFSACHCPHFLFSPSLFSPFFPPFSTCHHTSCLLSASLFFLSSPLLPFMPATILTLCSLLFSFPCHSLFSPFLFSPFSLPFSACHHPSCLFSPSLFCLSPSFIPLFCVSLHPPSLFSHSLSYTNLSSPCISGDHHLQCPYTVKKLFDIPVPSRDVTYQTLPQQE